MGDEMSKECSAAAWGIGMSDSWNFKVAGLLDARQEIADDEAKGEPASLSSLYQKITMTFMMFELVDCPGVDFGYLGSLLTRPSLWFEYCCRLAEKLVCDKRETTPYEEIMLYARLASLQQKLCKAAINCRLRAPIPEPACGESGLPNAYHCAKQALREARRKLLAAYADYADVAVRRDAMLFMDDEGTLAALARHGKYDDVRFEAVRRIGWIEKPGFETKKAIAHLAKDDANPRMRLAAVALLGDKRLLRHIAKSDPSDDVREAAARKVR